MAQFQKYLVLGDNRDNSEDSRAFGPIHEDPHLGKVVAMIATGQRTR